MKKHRGKLPVLAIGALFVVAVIGGTFAYFSQTTSASNYLTARNYDSTLTETFTPPEDGNFTPGVEVAKEVGVTNSGDVGMLVRLTYEEYWDNVLNGALSLAAPTDTIFPPTFYYDEDADSMVLKESGGYGDPSWVYGGDGYYYYLTELVPGASTDPFITAIMLKESLLTETFTYVVQYWDGLAMVFSDPLDAAGRDTLLAQIADNSDSGIFGNNDGNLDPGEWYLASVVSNTTTDSPTGNYELKFTVETIQAISAAADDWELSASDPDVLAFLASIM